VKSLKVKVSILDAYLFNNKGDVAILEGTLKAFRNSRKFNIKVTTVLGFNHKLWMKKLSKHYDITFCPNLPELFLLKYLITKSKLQYLKDPISCLKAMKHYMGEHLSCTIHALREARNASLVWVLGGIPYSDIKDFSGAIFGMSRLLSVIGIVKALKKKCIIGGQSIGGNYLPMITSIVGKNMLKCDYVILREPFSYNLLKKIKILNSCKTKISLGYDYAFNCEPRRTRNIDSLVDEVKAVTESYGMKKAVTMNISCHVINHVHQLIELGKKILSEGYTLIIYPHDVDDVKISLDFFQQLTRAGKDDYIKHVLLLNTMPYTASELYYFLNSLASKGVITWNISLRSHSAIAHLSNLIPTFHIAYSFKGIELMKMLKLERYVLPLNNLDWKKIKKHAFLVSNESEEYKAYLKDLIPYIRHKIDEQTDAGIEHLMKY